MPIQLCQLVLITASSQEKLILLTFQFFHVFHHAGQFRIDLCPLHKLERTTSAYLRKQCFTQLVFSFS